MVNLEDIPFEDRWKIATRSASSVPLMYDSSFGPEFRYEEPKGTEDGIAGKITGCAVLNRAKEMGLDPKIVALPACNTMIGSVVESLNPEYNYRSGKNMFSGDEYCETIIERRR